VTFLADINFDKLLPQLIFVAFLAWSAIRTARARRAEVGRLDRRRRGAPPATSAEEPPQEALQRELLERVRELQRAEAEVEAPPSSASYPSALEEQDEDAAPLGLDLAEVEESLPSRHEEQFESRLLGAEGMEALPALRSREPRPRRRIHRSHLGSPAALRRAIITAELLGPPVALRGDSLSRPLS
jgi:hypothetical protein